MNKITEAFHLMDLMKKRYLQLEYLSKLDQLNYSGCINNIQSIDELAAFLKDDIEYMETHIPEAIIDFMDDGDYEVYTYDRHRRKFWNEIELPDKVQRYFDIFQNLMGGELKDTSKYELQFYDLYPNSLYFDDLEALEKLIEAEDLAPFTAYENDNYNGISNELYSA